MVLLANFLYYLLAFCFSDSLACASRVSCRKSIITFEYSIQCFHDAQVTSYFTNWKWWALAAAAQLPIVNIQWGWPNDFSSWNLFLHLFVCIRYPKICFSPTLTTHFCDCSICYSSSLTEMIPTGVFLSILASPLCCHQNYASCVHNCMTQLLQSCSIETSLCLEYLGFISFSSMMQPKFHNRN